MTSSGKYLYITMMLYTVENGGCNATGRRPAQSVVGVRHPCGTVHTQTQNTLIGYHATSKKGFGLSRSGNRAGNDTCGHIYWGVAVVVSGRQSVTLAICFCYFSVSFPGSVLLCVSGLKSNMEWSFLRAYLPVHGLHAQHVSSRFQLGYLAQNAPETVQ